MVRAYVARAAQNARVGLLMASGVLAAAQIGKAIISVPLIRAEMSIGLDLAGLIVGTFATLGATFGIGAGVLVRGFGARRSLAGGMACIAVGNVIGSVAPNEWYLLFGRFIEGVGFLGVVLTIPSLLATMVDRERRDFVMAVWSAYMPAGIALMLLIAPLLPTFGWRLLWIASAGVSGLFAGLLFVTVPSTMIKIEQQRARWFEEVMTIVRRPYCVALALAFFAFSFQIFSMMFALPLVLTSVHGLSITSAGLLSAAMLTVAAIGNVSSGFLLRSGVPVWANIASAFVFFGVSSFAVYATATPLPATLIFASLALGIGSLAPGALYAAAPEAAQQSNRISSTIGLLQQASNLGQFTGPFVLGLWAEHFGWSAAPGILAPAASFGLLTALFIRGFGYSLKTRPVNSGLG
jgi:MFS transporter, DHA1 family, inner membrane transport protein